jgi:hypothetical protein
MFVSMRAKKPAGIKLQYFCQYEDTKKKKKKKKKNKKQKNKKNKKKQKKNKKKIPTYMYRP